MVGRDSVENCEEQCDQLSIYMRHMLISGSKAALEFGGSQITMAIERDDWLASLSMPELTCGFQSDCWTINIKLAHLSSIDYLVYFVERTDSLCLDVEKEEKPVLRERADPAELVCSSQLAEFIVSFVEETILSVLVPVHQCIWQQSWSTWQLRC